MQSQEALIKQLNKIAAASHGQLPTVRTVQGRQMFFLSESQAMFLLPHSAPADLAELDGNTESHLQVLDESSPDFGTYYVLPDIDPADGGTSIVP